jgi:hypothetical protein
MACRIVSAVISTVLLSAGAAHALSLPVDGVYGTSDGCKLLSKHGVSALVQAGGTENLGTGDIEAIIVTPNEVIGPDWTCHPSTVDGANAALDCVTEGATWVPMPIATARPDRELLLFTFDDEPMLKLRKCES